MTEPPAGVKRSAIIEDGTNGSLDTTHLKTILNQSDETAVIPNNTTNQPQPAASSTATDGSSLPLVTYTHTLQQCQPSTQTRDSTHRRRIRNNVDTMDESIIPPAADDEPSSLDELRIVFPESPSISGQVPLFHASPNLTPRGFANEIEEVEEQDENEKDESITALATDVPVIPETIDSKDSCSCFAVQYTCAYCKAHGHHQQHHHHHHPSSSNSSDVASSAGSSTSTLTKSSAASTASPSMHSPTEFASTRTTSPIVSPYPQPSSSISPSTTDEDDRYQIPTISLAALEAEIQQKYGLDEREEERAVLANKRAIEKQVHDEQEANRRRPSIPIARKGPTVYGWDEIRQHRTAESCWLVVRGIVYDVTPMLSTHPAGIKSILRNGGTEASEHFDFHSSAAHKLWKKYEIGTLEGYKTNSCTIQ